MADQPNVLFVCTDQHQAQAVGAVDATFVTPHLDRLADEGTLFTGCHCTVPQCSPSRSSLLTGQYPHQTGMVTLTDQGPGPLDPDSPSVAREFRDAGYETAFFGRWHLGENNMADLGWNVTERVFPERYDDWDNLHAVDEEIIDAASRYLSSAASQEPFFATVSFNLPHPTFKTVEAFADRYDADSIHLPENFDDELAEKPTAHRERVEQLELTPEEVREIRYQYRTMVSQVDHYVDHLLDALREAGVYDETIIVFTSDHGDMQGSHRVIRKGCLAYDEILRVPLVVRIPWHESELDEIADLVSNAAIPGTMLDAAGLPVPDDFTGGSFLPAFARDAPPDDECVFFEHKFAFPGEHPYRGVRTREWKYVEYVADGEEELYHMTDDLLELHNVASDSDRADVKSTLHAMIESWWDDTDGDLASWKELYDR